MNIAKFICLLPIAGLLVSFGSLATAQSVTTIAFGSCAKERQEQPIWDQILMHEPDLFLMIGDNHYADFWERDGRVVMTPVTDVSRIKEAYQVLSQKPGFQRLRQHCPVMATWDDHDYGANDMGNDYPLRQESQQAFLDFFGFANDDPLRKQQGIYHSKFFDSDGRQLQVIMLDTRFHRDSLEESPRTETKGGPYGPTSDSSKTILGEEQWKWLENEFRKPADIRIVATSIQIVADQHGWETWGNFPHERQRMYHLIDETGANGVFFISGDRHLIEICRDSRPGAPYPIWDFTSSGLTQKTASIEEANRFRIGPVHRENNFGLIRIDWADQIGETRIHLEGFGGRNQMLTRQTLFLDDLSKRSN